MAPCSHYCADLEQSIYRLLGVVPPFGAVDWDKLHREAFPDAAHRPARLCSDFGDELKLSEVMEDSAHL